MKVQVLTYLRANGFKTYIVSGGTVEFMRPWTERTYGILLEQVVGTSFLTTYKLGTDGKPMLLRQPKIDFITPTTSGNGPTTVNPTSAGSIERSTRRRAEAGRSST